MDIQDITTCRSTKLIELDHQAMHNDLDAQMAEFKRLGGRVEHIADGVHGEDYCGKKPQPGYRGKAIR